MAPVGAQDGVDGRDVVMLPVDGIGQLVERAQAATVGRPGRVQAPDGVTVGILPDEVTGGGETCPVGLSLTS